MAPKELKFGNKIAGWIFEDKKCFAFFGTKYADLDFCNKLAGVSIRFLKQTHSDIVVESSENREVTGDSHYTNKKNAALGVYTADCVSVLIYSNAKIGAIHAGWRGIESQIICKTIVNFEPKKANVFIGPHIKLEHFEVHSDVGLRLQAATHYNEVVLRKHADPKKVYVDLTSITISQLKSQGVQKNQIQILPFDTFGDEMFYSYRREGKTGRLISFIKLK